MSLETIEINRFKKRINTFSRWFFRYKEFVDLSSYIESLLTPEQKQILECKYGEEIIDFKLQLLLYFEDRYDSGLDLEELKEKASKVLKKYSFLFETNLDFSQIRTIFLRELMEVISIGSQCFHYRRIHISKFFVHANSFHDIFEDYSFCLRRISFMRREIITRYPNLPGRIEKIYKKSVEFQFFQEFFWENYALIFDKEDSLEKWKLEFFEKTKWFLEQLNSCEEEYRNKYREKIYKEACNSINVGQNCSHIYFPSHRWSKDMGGRPWKNVSIKYKKHINLNLQEIVSEILDCFKEEELEKLSNKDSRKNQWSFKKQLLDRYYSKYSSLISMDDLRSKLRKTVFKYKPLLLIENKTEIIKELLLETLEKELFISKSTYVWNKEMIGNLCTLKKAKISKSVKWAVEQTIKFIGLENIEKLSLKIEWKEYDFKTLLTSRWSRAWLVRGKSGFREKLLIAFIKTGLEKEITKENLNSLLEELDSCFLYPNPKVNRVKSFLFRKDETEDIPKWKKNMWTVYIELGRRKFFGFLFSFSVIMLFLIIIVASILKNLINYLLT